jgi:hypothetical protein
MLLELDLVLSGSLSYANMMEALRIARVRKWGLDFRVRQVAGRVYVMRGAGHPDGVDENFYEKLRQS